MGDYRYINGYKTRNEGVCAAVPKNADPRPIVESLPEGHIRPTAESVKAYYEQVLGDGDVSELNIIGVCGSDIGGRCVGFMCDYCNARSGQWMWRCEVCRKEMCDECHDERTDAQRDKTMHGHDRKTALEKCFEHERRGVMVVNEFNPRHANCDECGCDLGDDDAPKGVWAVNRREDLDYCPKCRDRIPEEERRKYRDVDTNYPLIAPQVRAFGSLLDWAPVLEDAKTGDRVLVNINQDSPHRGKVGFMIVLREEGCLLGYSIMPGSLEKVVKLIAEAGSIKKVAAADNIVTTF